MLYRVAYSETVACVVSNNVADMRTPICTLGESVQNIYRLSIVMLCNDPNKARKVAISVNILCAVYIFCGIQMEP